MKTYYICSISMPIGISVYMIKKIGYNYEFVE